MLTLRNYSFSCYKYLKHRNFHRALCATQSNKDVSSPAVVVSEDGNTIFCWHPEPSFPYEHTKPLPRNEQETKLGDSVLKVQHLKEAEVPLHRVDGPSDKELMKMFSTTVHQWRHQPRKRRRKINPPVDRESI